MIILSAHNLAKKDSLLLNLIENTLVRYCYKE